MPQSRATSSSHIPVKKKKTTQFFIRFSLEKKIQIQKSGLHRLPKIAMRTEIRYLLYQIVFSLMF